MWELPEFARFLDRLAAMGWLILFDKRGTGLSDRVAGMPTLEHRADGIAAVMDAAGSSRAAVVAWGAGAAIAAMFAATHPERVLALVLGSLATMLFTDIVGSTQQVGQLGDRRWRYLLEEHHARIRRLLDLFRGTEVDTAGDGFFAILDGPARAIRCACAVRDAVRDIGLEVWAGLHTGEVERRGVAGADLAVHVSARVAALAQANEVLVTSTAQMLVLGSDQLRRPGRAPAQGRSGPVAAVRRGAHLMR